MHNIIVSSNLPHQSRINLRPFTFHFHGQSNSFARTLPRGSRGKSHKEYIERPHLAHTLRPTIRPIGRETELNDRGGRSQATRIHRY